MRPILLFAILLILSGTHLYAQTDSSAIKNTTDTTVVKLNKLPPHPPKKAALMSACLPGLGQAYNKKYWKIPIIYAGFGGLGYSFGFNHSYFKKYRNSLRGRLDNDPNTIDFYPQYSDDDLVTLKQYYQRWRDLSLIGMAALYTLNIIDASVDAHLFYFNVSDDLSLRASPFMIPTAQGPITGFGIQLGWR